MEFKETPIWRFGSMFNIKIMQCINAISRKTCRKINSGSRKAGRRRLIIRLDESFLKKINKIREKYKNNFS